MSRQCGARRKLFYTSEEDESSVDEPSKSQPGSSGSSTFSLCRGVDEILQVESSSVGRSSSNENVGLDGAISPPAILSPIGTGRKSPMQSGISDYVVLGRETNSQFDRIVADTYSHLDRPWILRSTIYYDSDTERNRLLYRLLEPNPGRPRGVRIVCDHPRSEASTFRSHFHIFHDCTFHRGQCRCKFVSGLGIIQQAKHRLRTEQFGIGDLISVLEYYSEKGKYIHSIILGNRGAPVSNLSKMLQDRRCEGAELVGEVQEGVCEHIGSRKRSLSAASNSGSDGSNLLQGNGKSRRSSDNVRSQLDEMLGFFYKYTVVPLECIVKSRWWLNSKYKFISLGDKEFIKCRNVFNANICKMTLQDLKQFWLSKSVYYWDTDYYKTSVKQYMPLQESVQFTKQFLLHQFYEEEFVIEFLTFMSKLLNRELNKMNSVEVISPPTSGKNWFFDSICTLCVSYGQIQNHNKYSRFALEHAIGKRVNMYNEPNFDKAFKETLLMLLAGDPITAEAKYQSHQAVEKTPVIILGNTSRFPMESQWKERIKRYTWRQAPMLKGKHYCHPLTFIFLLDMYNIEYN